MNDTAKVTPEASFTLLLATLACTVFSLMTAQGMLGPLLRDMAQDLGTTVPIGAQLATAETIAWAATAVMIGPFSDAYGRKPFLLCGALLVSAGAIGMALASSLSIASVFRILAGIGGGMIPPTCVAIIGDFFPEERRASSIATIAMQPGLSSIFGVPLAALLAATAGWRTTYSVVGVAVLGCAVALFFLVPYRRSDGISLDLSQRLRKIGRFPVTWSLTAANMTGRLSMGVMMIFFPVFLQVTYDLGTAEVALPVSLMAVGATLGTYLGGQIGKRPNRLLLGALTIGFSTLPALAVFVWGGSLWLTVGTASVFMACVMPVTSLLMIVGAELAGPSRGTMVGLLSGSGFLGFAVASSLGGFLVAQIGYGALSVVLDVVTAASGLCLLFLQHSQAEQRARAYFGADTQ